jgi:hypothetical protein
MATPCGGKLGLTDVGVEREVQNSKAVSVSWRSSIKLIERGAGKAKDICSH